MEFITIVLTEIFSIFLIETAFVVADIDVSKGGLGQRHGSTAESGADRIFQGSKSLAGRARRHPYKDF